MANDTPYEADDQIKLAVWLSKRNILFAASANGGSRHPHEAMKLKRTGVKAGWPDLQIPVARQGYHGLFIELKRVRGGNTRDEQKYWIEALNKEGYLAVIARGFEAAKKVVQDYFRLSYCCSKDLIVHEDDGTGIRYQCPQCLEMQEVENATI